MPRIALIPGIALFAVAATGIAQRFSPTPGNVPEATGQPFDFMVSVMQVAPNVFTNLTYLTPATLPPGVTFKTLSPGPGAIADLSGTITAPGNYPVNVTFTATVNGSLISGTGTYTFVVTNPVSIAASPTTIGFEKKGTYFLPQFQNVDVTATAPTKFTATLDDGSGGPAPTEFLVTPNSCSTPCRLAVRFSKLS